MNPLRLVLALALFLWSLMCVFRAPSYGLWIAALVATENGHALWLLCLLPLLPGWEKDALGRASVALSAAAALLFLSPWLRARPVAARLPAALSGSFAGAEPRSRPGAPSLKTPLSLRLSFQGLGSPPIREESFVYSRFCGGLSLQLYRPLEASSPLPLVVAIHGGSWRSGDRLELPGLARYLAARGYAVASIDYALAPGAVFPGPVEDVRDAVGFLRSRAGELGLDASRFVLLGRSAGAQIALAAAHAPEPISGVAGVVDFYGPNDLYLAWAEPGSILASRQLLAMYLGGSPGEHPERYDEASPLLRAGKASPPVLMIHGGRDELVWPVHQSRLSAALKSAGVPHHYLALPWATHGCDYFLSGPCGQLSTYAVERFLAAVL